MVQLMYLFRGVAYVVCERAGLNELSTILLTVDFGANISESARDSRLHLAVFDREVVAMPKR